MRPLPAPCAGSPLVPPSAPGTQVSAGQYWNIGVCRGYCTTMYLHHSTRVSAAPVWRYTRAVQRYLMSVSGNALVHS
eukprot:1154898-Rhodomonas_salina.2